MIMKRPKGARVAFTLLLLLLTYTAFDDITTGEQASFTAEYAMLLVAGAFIGLLFISIKRRKE